MDERLLKIAVLLGRADGLLDAWSDREEATHLVYAAQSNVQRAVALFLQVQGEAVSEPQTGGRDDG